MLYYNFTLEKEQMKDIKAQNYHDIHVHDVSM